MTVSAIFPTVEGREESLARALASLPDCDPIVLSDYPTCGAAWVQGAREAQGDYIFFAADDIEAHPGFLNAMCATVDRGFHPAAVVLEPDGSLQSCGGNGWDCCRQNCPDGAAVEWSPTSFIAREHWALIEPHAEALADLHYASDMLVSALLTDHGIPAAVCRGAVMTHYNHPAKRGAGMGQHERTARDRAAFKRYREGL
jgi:hypothetical protein